MNSQPKLLSLLLVPFVAVALRAEEPATPAKLTKMEQQLVDLTNALRAKSKSPALKVQSIMMQSARSHSQNMARQARLSHTLDGKSPGDRLRNAGYQWSAMAENVAITVQEDPNEILNQWLNSPSHRQNMLDADVSEIGVGLSRSANGNVYCTAIFASR